MFKGQFKWAWLNGVAMAINGVMVFHASNQALAISHVVLVGVGGLGTGLCIAGEVYDRWIEDIREVN